jgi:hypothetical protein
MVRRCLVLAALVTALVIFALVRPLSASSPTLQTNSSVPVDDPSGMYSFLREGEFVQLTVEDGKVSGYVSRFGDTDSDKGQFIDQFFDKASLAGDHLSFNTKMVHGVWYDFKGVITKTPGKKPGQEDYRIIKGTLVQHATDARNDDKPSQWPVEFKSFPQDLSKP